MSLACSATARQVGNLFMRSLNQRTSSSALSSLNLTFLLGRPAAISQSCCIRTKGIEPSANGVDQRRLEIARLLGCGCVLIDWIRYIPKGFRPPAQGCPEGLRGYPGYAVQMGFYPNGVTSPDVG